MPSKVYVQSGKRVEWSVYKKMFMPSGKEEYVHWESFPSERLAKKAYEAELEYDSDPGFRVVKTVHYFEKIANVQ